MERLAAFFQTHYWKLLRALLKKGVQHADAEDALQTAYLKLRDSGVELEQMRYPKAYLLRVAIREWLRTKSPRRGAGADEDELPVEAAASEPSADTFDWEVGVIQDAPFIARDQMSDALALGVDFMGTYEGLPKDIKSVCKLMMEGMGPAEIVAKTDLTRDQVERRMKRVRDRFKGLL